MLGRDCDNYVKQPTWGAADHAVQGMTSARSIRTPCVRGLQAEQTGAVSYFIAVSSYPCAFMHWT